MKIQDQIITTTEECEDLIHDIIAASQGKAYTVPEFAEEMRWNIEAYRQFLPDFAALKANSRDLPEAERTLAELRQILTKLTRDHGKVMAWLEEGQ